MCAFELAKEGGLASGEITIEFEVHKQWLTEIYYEQIIRPSLVKMTEQLTAVALTQVGMIGNFFDAKSQLETQLVLDQYHVDAIRDYQPSTALCKFGTSMRGLASSEQRSSVNQELFMVRALDRHLGAEGASAATANMDIKARLLQFRTIYCDPNDNGGDLVSTSGDAFCGTSGGKVERYNKDINYTKTLGSPKTLNINLTDETQTADEADVIALANNLFGYDVLSRPALANLRGNEKDYHAARSVIAKRSVAENSFYALAADKAEGTGASREYLKEIVEALGYPDTPLPGSGSLTQIDMIFGDNPSYYSQMEILTKKIYQDPNFIVSLIDKPANVERQKAAMQSFRIMQQRDFYESLVRQELVLSLILEELLFKKFNTVRQKL